MSSSNRSKLPVPPSRDRPQDNNPNRRMSALQKSVIQKNKVLDKEKSKVAKLEKLLMQTEGDIATSREKVSSLKASLAVRDKELESTRTEAKAERELVVKLKVELAELSQVRDTLATHERALSDRQQELSTAQTELKRQTSSIQSLKAQLSDMESRANSAEKGVEEYKAAKQSSEHDLNLRISSLESRAQKAEHDCIEVTRDVESLQRHRAECEEKLSMTMESVTKKEAALSSELTKQIEQAQILRDSLAQAESRLASAEQFSLEMQKKVEHFQRITNLAERKAKDSDAIAHKKSKEVDALQLMVNANLSSADDEAAGFKNREEMLQSTIAELTAKLEQLSTSSSESSRDLDFELQALQAHNQALTSTVTAKDQALAVLKEQVSIMERNYTMQRADLESRHNETVSDLKSKLKSAEVVVLNLEGDKQALSSAVQSTVSELTGKLSSTAGEVKALKVEKETLLTSISEKDAEVVAQRDQFQDTIHRLESDIASTRTEATGQLNDVTNTLNAKVSAAQARIAETAKEKENLVSQLRSANNARDEDVAKMSGELRDKAEEINFLLQFQEARDRVRNMDFSVLEMKEQHLSETLRAREAFTTSLRSDLAAAVSTHTSQAHELQISLSKTEDALTAARGQLQGFADERERLTTEAEELQTKLTSATGVIADVKRGAALEHEDDFNLAHKIQASHTELRKAIAERGRVSETLCTVQIALRLKSEENAKLHSRVKELECRLGKQSILGAKLQTASSFLEKELDVKQALEAKVSKMSESLEHVGTELERARARILLMQLNHSGVSRQAAELEEENATLKSDQDIFKRRLSSLEDALSAKDADLGFQLGRVEALSTDLAKTSNKKEELAEMLKQTNALLMDAQEAGRSSVNAVDEVYRKKMRTAKDMFVQSHAAEKRSREAFGAFVSSLAQSISVPLSTGGTDEPTVQDLQTQASLLLVSVAERMDTVEELTKGVEDLHTSNECLVSESEKLHAEIAEMKVDNQRGEEEMKARCVREDELIGDITRYKVMLEEATKLIDASDKEAADKAQYHQDMVNELKAEQNATCTGLMKKVKSQGEDLVNCRNTLHHTSQQLETLKMSYEEANSRYEMQHKVLVENMEKASTKITELERLNEDTSQKNVVLSEEKEDLMRRLRSVQVDTEGALTAATSEQSVIRLKLTDAERTVRSLSEQLQASNEESESLRSRCANAEHELKTSITRIGELSRALEELSTSKQSLADSLKATRCEIDNLRKAEAELRNEKENIASGANTSDTNLREAREEIYRLQDAISNLKSTSDGAVSRHEVELFDLRASLEEEHAKNLDDVKAECDKKLEDAATCADETVGKMKQQIENLTEQCTSLQEKLDTLNNAMTSKTQSSEEEVNKLQEKLERALHAHAILQSGKEDVESKLAENRRALDELCHENDKLQDDLQAKSRLEAELSDKLQTRDQAIRKLEENCTRHTTEIKRIEGERDQRDERIEEARRKAANADVRASDVEAECEKLRKSCASLTESNEVLHQSARVKKDEMQRELDNCKKMVDDKQDALRKLQAQLREKSDELTTREEKLSNVTSALRSSERYKQAVDAKLAETLKEHRAENELSSKRYGELEDRVAAIRESERALKIKLESLQGSNDELKLEVIPSLEIKVRESQDELARSSAALERKEAELQDMEEKGKEVERLSKALEKTTEDAAHAQKQRSDIEHALSDSKQRIANMANEHSGLRKRVVELEEEVETMNDSCNEMEKTMLDYQKISKKYTAALRKLRRFKRYEDVERKKREKGRDAENLAETPQQTNSDKISDQDRAGGGGMRSALRAEKSALDDRSSTGEKRSKRRAMSMAASEIARVDKKAKRLHDYNDDVTISIGRPPMYNASNHLNRSHH